MLVSKPEDEVVDEVVKEDENRVMTSAEIMDKNVDDYLQGKRKMDRVGKYIRAQRQVDRDWVRSNQMTSFKVVSKVQGDIVSWAYDGDLKVCIVKWEKGVQYYRFIKDVLSLPR